MNLVIGERLEERYEEEASLDLLRQSRLSENSPLGFYGGDTNLYRFEGDDPTDTVDPSGLKAEKKRPEPIVDPLPNPFAGLAPPVATSIMKLMMNPTSVEAARDFWRNISNEVLVPRKWAFAYLLMTHSLQNNPKDLRFTKDSFGSKLIRSSPEYQAKIKEIVRKKISGCPVGEFQGKDAIRFDKGELFAAIHDADIEYNGVKKADGSWQMTVKVKDRWDFHLQSYFKDSLGELAGKMLQAELRRPNFLRLKNGMMLPGFGWMQPLYDQKDRILGILANNLAAASQVTGAVQNYDWVSENLEQGVMGK